MSHFLSILVGDMLGLLILLGLFRLMGYRVTLERIKRLRKARADHE
jgi:nitrate reductase gamma subunit